MVAIVSVVLSIEGLNLILMIVSPAGILIARNK